MIFFNLILLALKNQDVSEDENYADVDDAENDDDNDDADEPEPGIEPGIERPKPMKKTEFYKIYSSKGPHQMYCDIMNDPTLRAVAEMICRVTRPLHLQYQRDLKAQIQGEDVLREWNASRSLGSSFSAVSDILTMMTSRGLHKAMRLAPFCDPPLPCDASVLAEDIELIEKTFKFGVHLAGNYAWGEMLHRLTLPFAAVPLVSKDMKSRKAALRHLRKMVEAIVKAEEHPAMCNECLRDLAFTEEPFPRELMVLVRRGKYDINNEHITEATKALTYFTLGSSSTKEILESTFGHLAHIVGKNSTNKSLAASSKWMYLTSSPYVKASGMPQLLPWGEEWIQWIGEYGHAESEYYRMYNKGFKASSTPLPTSPDIQMPKTSQGVLKTEWRLSGPASHYASSAAMAYLMHDSDENFAHADSAWSGLVETNKHQSS